MRGSGVAGFRQIGLPYKQAAREGGEPKYSLRALVFLAVDGLIGFSSYPLRLVTLLGSGHHLLGDDPADLDPLGCDG